MSPDKISVRLQVKTGEAVNVLVKALESKNGFRTLGPEDPQSPQLLIIEIGDNSPGDLQTVQSLLSTGAVDEVFLTSTSTDPDLLVQALRVGAREFFTQPMREADVLQALDRFNERRGRARDRTRILKSGRIIDVIGSKGGVGNTTVAVNLATTLAGDKKSKSVVLVDMNLLFGEVPLFLDIEPTYHWGEIARNIARLDATFLMNVLHRHPCGVFVLPSPSQLNGSFAATPEIIERLLTLMRTVFDYIIVDSGHVTEDVSLKILEMSDTVLLTAILSLPCLSNVSRFLQLFYDLGYPPEENVKVLINRYIKNSDISLKDAEKSIGREIFRTIPNDYKVTMSAINQGKVLADVSGKSPVVKSIRDLAVSLVDRDESEKRGSSFFDKLLGR